MKICAKETVVSLSIYKVRIAKILQCKTLIMIRGKMD